MRWFFFLLALPLASGSAAAVDLPARYGIKVVDRNLASVIVPLMEQPDRRVAMTDVTPADEGNCLATVSRALDAYPPQLISALINTIALAEDLHAWGRSVGGIQVPGVVVVSCINSGVNARYQEADVHEAIAALVMQASPPDWPAWQAANPSGFAYGNFNAYKVELSDNSARDLAARLNGDGFVNRYGLKTYLAVAPTLRRYFDSTGLTRAATPER